MLLERKVIQTLESYSISKNSGITRQDFLIYLTKLERLNNCTCPKKYRYINTINHLLDDCSEGDDKFIAYNKDTGIINVTKRGRDFIKWTGFFEEFLRRRGRSHQALVQILTSFIAGGLVTLLVQHLLK